jgi:DNA-binding NtrC family response regulator
VIEIVAVSDTMREAATLAERVAATDANVLITGESGAGKDAMAAFIHARSNRAGKTLVKIDCATLPADLLEAELFGYEAAPSPERLRRSRVGWRQRIARRLYWTRSRTFLSMRRRNSCA